MPTEIKYFSTIQEEFLKRVHDAVWCNAATTDSQNRPRSRVLHPYWEGQIGWIPTYPHSYKSKHLERTPYMSLAYLKDPLKPVYVDCKTEWITDMAEKERIWNLFGKTAPPLGYDLALAFESLDSPKYGLLKLHPWRIELYDLVNQEERKIWRAKH